MTARRGEHDRDTRRCLAAVVLALGSLTATACNSAHRPENIVVAETDATGRSARLLSAFYGLDDNLPFGAHLLCLGGGGRDGMPVILSHTVDNATLDAEDFRVMTRGGAAKTPLCATLFPATDAGEGRTVLLIGDLGSATEDPPLSVTVAGDLVSDGRSGGPVNFKGQTVAVTPLEAGPSLVLAEVVPSEIWTVSGRGSACPPESRQVVRVTWEGGVRRPDGENAGDRERELYRVTVRRADGSLEVIQPDVLAELGDNDNNHLLCMNTVDPVVAVAFPGGYLVDPNQDRNPDTRIELTDGNNQGNSPPDA